MSKERIYQIGKELIEISKNMDKGEVPDEPETPTPDPETPVPDGNYTIRAHEIDKNKNNMKLAEGQNINLHAQVLKQNSPAGAGIPVIIETYRGTEEQLTESNGAVGARNLIQQTGGMRIIFTLKNNPSESVSFVIKDSGGNFPESGTGGSGKDNGGEKPPVDDPINDPDPVDDSDNGKPIHYPNGNGTEVLVMFSHFPAAKPYVGVNPPPHPIDVKINGVWYPLSRETNWDAVLDGDPRKGVGIVFNLPGQFHSFEFNPNQVRKDHLNNGGYGWWFFQMNNVSSKVDLYNPSGKSSSKNYWHKTHSTGAIVGASTWNSIHKPDIWTPDNYHKRLSSNLGPFGTNKMNETGKVVIMIMGHGINNANFDEEDNFNPVG